MKTTFERQERLEKIKELMAAKLTQQEIADRLGVSRTQIVNDCALLKEQKKSTEKIAGKPEVPEKEQIVLPEVINEDVIAQKTMESMYLLLDKIGKGGTEGERASVIYARMWGENS